MLHSCIRCGVYIQVVSEMFALLVDLRRIIVGGILAEVHVFAMVLDF